VSPKSNKGSRSQLVTAEDQQQRIRNLINEVRRGGLLSTDATMLTQTELNRIKVTSKPPLYLLNFQSLELYSFFNKGRIDSTKETFGRTK